MIWGLCRLSPTGGIESYTALPQRAVTVADRIGGATLVVARGAGRHETGPYESNQISAVLGDPPWSDQIAARRRLLHFAIV